MDDPRLRQLPRIYELGLRLEALGANHELIAACLDLDVGSVPALLEIGARKLEHAHRGCSVDHPATTLRDGANTDTNQ